MMLPHEPTAPSAWALTYWPTTMVSTILYSCEKTLLNRTGTAKISIFFMMLPVVMSWLRMDLDGFFSKLFLLPILFFHNVIHIICFFLYISIDETHNFFICIDLLSVGNAGIPAEPAQDIHPKPAAFSEFSGIF